MTRLHIIDDWIVISDSDVYQPFVNGSTFVHMLTQHTNTNKDIRRMVHQKESYIVRVSFMITYH